MLKNPPVIAIGIDSGDWYWICSLTQSGQLPNLARLLSHSSPIQLRHLQYYSDETPWTHFLTGCSSGTTGHWSPLRFLPHSYEAIDAGSYPFEKLPLFYRYHAGRRVLIFDVPHCGKIENGLSGCQILGWGSHSQLGPSQSHPERLLRQVIKKHGNHPAYDIQNRGAWWRTDFLDRLYISLLEGIRRRTRILQELLTSINPEFSLIVMSECHVAQHHFWHLSDPQHPLYDWGGNTRRDYLPRIYAAVDEAIGDVMAAAGTTAIKVCFSLHGAAANSDELPSMLFLPEFLYRYSFPERHRLLSNARSQQDGRLQFPLSHSWIIEAWGEWIGAIPAYRHLRDKTSEHAWPLADQALRYGLLAGWTLYRGMVGSLFWQPATWYRRYWPKMKAFALPTYGDGYVRVNLKGREAAGIVEADDYHSILSDITDQLRSIKSPLTKQPLVKEIIVTRTDPRFRECSLPDADLIVLWNKEILDRAESPALGAVGPFPLRMTGGHRPEGFAIIDDPHCGRPFRRSGDVLDLAPTLLELSGIPMPSFFEGRPLSQQG
jgi:predicted AlkP superfamily phosphohydrolase/phosphomutase